MSDSGKTPSSPAPASPTAPLSEADRAAALARGLDLERQGQLEQAYHAFIGAGLVDEAARLLASHGRAADAADVLVAYVTRRPRPLDNADRMRALTAADLLIDSQLYPRAAELFAWLGATDRGHALLARVQETKNVVDIGACMVRLGDPARGIDALLKIPRADPRYPRACVECARGLMRGAAMTMELDRFLADFIRKGPDDDAEAEALYAIAAAYAREGFPENAVEALVRIEARRPGYRDVAAQIKRLEAGARGAVGDLARVLDEDARFLEAQQSSKPNPQREEQRKETTRVDDPSGDHVTADAAAALSAESFAPGVVLAKRYRLEELIGKGGMSLVYRATDKELNDTVALKIFTQPTNEDALARFKQEVLLARQLIHRNIVRVYDLGTALGARFLTMELLVGEDLHTKMVRGLTLRDGIDALIQACAGLEAAHQVGVIHRDVKPENLFVTNEGVIKVTDFGIAKQVKQPGLTVAGMVVGTPEYMAPEQAHGHMNVTHHADLYSLGIILYFLATRTLPFRHAELVPLLMMHVTQRPDPPRTRNPNLHPDVEELILQLLEKDPARRPVSARALGERLIELRLRGVV